MKFNLPTEQLPEFCRKWRIKELSLFGSVLRDDFASGNDVDVLVTFSPEAEWSLLDFVEMKEELTTLFGREVDFATRDGVEASRNPYRREAILSSARPVYVGP